VRRRRSNIWTPSEPLPVCDDDAGPSAHVSALQVARDGGIRLRFLGSSGLGSLGRRVRFLCGQTYFFALAAT
jgi:hypothetical protein